MGTLDIDCAVCHTRTAPSEDGHIPLDWWSLELAAFHADANHGEFFVDLCPDCWRRLTRGATTTVPREVLAVAAHHALEELLTAADVNA